MKKYIISVAFALAALCSCGKLNDILDKYPLDTVSPGSYFIDESQLQTYTNTCYSNLIPEGSTIYESLNDIYFKRSLTKRQRGGTMRTVASSDVAWDFGNLRHINTMFNYTDNCKDAAVKAKYIALAKFFRTYYYFGMVRDFGEVPWIDHELQTDSPELYYPRDTRDVLFSHMIEDIDYAIENLPATVESAYRINKWAALLLKSRMCLFEGTWRIYHANDAFKVESDKEPKYYLDLAAEAALKFIQESPYKIYSTGNPDLDYRMLFATQTANADEVVLARSYSLLLSYSHFASWISLQENGIAVNKKFVDSYLMKDGTRFTDKPGWETMEFYEEVENRDPRMAQTLRLPGYKRFGSDAVRVPQLSNTITGYQICKYDQGYDAVPDTWTATDSDLPVMRAAEVYLNYAEAKAEAGTLTQEDLDLSINVLRDRAGMPHLDMAYANANPDNNYLGNAKYGYQNVKGANKGVILEIRRERGVELAQEIDFRWYDLMRWKEGNCLSQKYLGMYFPGTGEYDFNHDGLMDICIYEGTKPATDALEVYKLNSEVYLSNGTSGNLNYIEAKKISHTFNEGRDYLCPIPQNELTLNKKLYQNPGWEEK